MMEDITDADKYEFQEEEMGKKLHKIIEETLKDQVYAEEEVQHWINSICEQSMTELWNSQKPFKYIVSCCITQRTGAGIHTAQSCHWDTVADRVLQVSWPKPTGASKASMLCIMTVYAIAFYGGN